MNGNHQRHIISTLRHAESQFVEIEAILTALGSRSPLSEYALDLQPAARGIIEDHLQRIRQEMTAILERFSLPLEAHRTSASWAIRNRLIGVSIAIAEMEPHYLRGYGELTGQDQIEIGRACGDLHRLVDRVSAYLERIRSGDAAERLEKVPSGAGLREPLVLLDEIIARHHLLELRPFLEMILSRIESPQFEIAFFGRVSSGKSSLLNHIVGQEILPVGVTPVTSVPTRLRAASESALLVRYELMSPQQLPIDRIAEFVTEAHNPGNRRGVSSVELLVQTSGLPADVTLVDTPGVGSLATSGAAQTMAYLPHCDLGVLLLDAGSTLNEDDLRLLRALSDAEVPVMVLLSKCDLLTADDRIRMATYIAEQVRAGLSLSLDVHPVSIVGQDSDGEPQPDRRDNWLTGARWFDEQVRPLLAGSRERAEASLRTKTAHLADLAIASLRTRASRDEARSRRLAQCDDRRLGSILERASDEISLTTQAVRLADQTSSDEQANAILDAFAAQRLQKLQSSDATDPHTTETLTLRGFATRAIADMAARLRRTLVALDRELQSAWRDMAAIAGHLHQDADGVVQRLEPLPCLDESTLAAIPEVRLPAAARVFPLLARPILRRQLRRKCFFCVETAVRDYQRLLRGWARRNLLMIVEAYEMRAELYRERMRPSAGSDGQADTPALDDDLRRLMGVRASMAVAEGSLSLTRSSTAAAGAASQTGGTLQPA